MSEFRLGIIGAGNLAGSVLRGLLRQGYFTPTDVIASQPIDALRAQLREETAVTVTTSNEEVAEKSGIILIGVKPSVVLPAIKEIQGALDNKLVISLAAGVRLSSMEAVAPARFLRVMTNTPSAIGSAATALARGSRSTEEDAKTARNIFEAIGIVVEVDESQIDTVTALAGSGPAFVYSIIEALAEGGKHGGLSSENALKLAAQTVRGAAELLLTSNRTPEELRKAVVTPGGTTAAGLSTMEEKRSLEGIAAAVIAAAERGREMARENQ